MRKIEALFEIRDRIYRNQPYSLWYNLFTDDVCLDLQESEDEQTVLDWIDITDKLERCDILDLNRVIKELRDSLLNISSFLFNNRRKQNERIKRTENSADIT